MKTVKILLVALFFVASSSVFAQQQKFGVINANEIMQAMPEFDSVKVKIEKVRQGLLEEMQANEKEYTTKMQDYTKNKDNYSETIRAQKEKELNGIAQRIQEFEQVAQAEMQDQQVKLMAPVEAKLIKAIEKVGVDNSFVFIFDKSSALYTSATLVVDANPLVRAELKLK